MGFKIFKFDFFAILMGMFLLYMTFSGVLNHPLIYEESSVFRMILSGYYILGSYSFIDGSYLLRSRYKKYIFYKKKGVVLK